MLKNKESFIKTKLFKKWWFWAISLFVIISIISGINNEFSSHKQVTSESNNHNITVKAKKSKETKIEPYKESNYPTQQDQNTNNSNTTQGNNSQAQSNSTPAPASQPPQTQAPKQNQPVQTAPTQNNVSNNDDNNVVYYVQGSKVYHLSREDGTLKRSKNVQQMTLGQAKSQGMHQSDSKADR